MFNNGIGSWPYRRARLSPDAIAISFRGTDFTYRTLSDRVTRLAHVLRERGVGPGDRVAVLSPNHPAYLEALFAAGILGAVFVPLNARLTSAEVGYALSDSGAKVVIHAGALADRCFAGGGGDVVGIALDNDPDSTVSAYDDLIAAASSDRIDEPVGYVDHCMIMYTSGSTGRPKGVVLTHHLVLFAVLNTVIDQDMARDDVALVMAPLFHSAALNAVALPTLLKGGRLIIEDNFDPGRALELVQAEGVTFSFGVPTMLDAMSRHPLWESADLTSIRRWIVGAAPVPLGTLRAYSARGVNVCQGYGLTETGPGAAVLSPSDAERKLGKTGTPQFFTDVRIVGFDGEPAGVGERGEIQISGDNVTDRYWNRPADTAAAFTDDGWFRTGDVGILDDEGFLQIVDRLKDLIISGGENIYPAEIEAELATMPGILGCAVFGVPDERWGEIGCAAVTVEPGTDVGYESMVEYLTPRVARYKIPKSLVLVDEIPRNATGKIRKDILREQALHWSRDS